MTQYLVTIHSWQKTDRRTDDNSYLKLDLYVSTVG